MLFISYSRKDPELADRLTEYLNRSGHEYWIDRQRINTGDRWGIELENGLRQATAVVVILTNHASKPDSFVRQELFYARRVLNKPIYTLVPESIAANEIPMEVADLQQIRCVNNFELGLEELMRILIPLEQGGCSIEVSPELAPILQHDSVEYAIMSRFPLTRTISVKAEITRGNSGSKVFFVDASFRNSDKPPAPHFLKINNAQNDEPRKRFEMAYKTKMQSSMPILSDATSWDKQSRRIGLLYGLGEARGGYVSLDELLDKNLAQAAAVIEKVCDALTDWNDSGRHNKNLPAHELLEHALCHSLDSDSRRSRLDKFADTSILYRSAGLLGVNEDSPLIDFETRYSLPNPLAYLAYDSLWRGEDKKLGITYPSGNIHGDLHVRNIQAIYKTRDKKSFALSVIDFDTYDPNNLIFVDFAFLEISVIIRLFGLDQESRQQENQHELERLSEYLAENLDLEDKIPDLNVLSVGTWVLLRPLREAAAKIADLHFEYEVAFWIARTAAALQLVRKRKSSHQERVLALLIAADSINHLVKELGMHLPRGVATSMEWSRNKHTNKSGTR